MERTVLAITIAALALGAAVSAQKTTRVNGGPS